MEDYICEVCGAKEWVLSRIHITACYGSVHDGADVTLNVCGKCLDAVISCLSQRAGGDTVADE